MKTAANCLILILFTLIITACGDDDHGPTGAITNCPSVGTLSQVPLNPGATPANATLPTGGAVPGGPTPASVVPPTSDAAKPPCTFQNLSLALASLNGGAGSVVPPLT